MSHLFYHLGDIASKPLGWGWANSDEDNKFVEWLVHINYSTYNWLMLKSCDFNDKSDCDVWRDYVDPEFDDEDDEEFTPITLKKDEK